MKAQETESGFVPVIDYLRRSAANFPQRPAFVGPEEISYEQFYARVRRWAGYFRYAGLQPGDRVAIWLPKQIDYVVALYAAMECGGVYVPMDGVQPVERAKKILAGAEPAILVTDSARFEQLDDTTCASLRLALVTDFHKVPDAAAPGCFAVASRASADAFEPTPEQTPHHPGPQDLAAILFTSGSTGMPKGVQISYGNLHAFIGWALQELSLSERDVFSNHAGFHFDLSTFDLFAAAAAGAGVWVIGEEQQRDVAALSEGIHRYGISVWYSVPSILSLMVNAGALDTDVTASLRYLIFAGEVFPIRPLRELSQRLPADCALYNFYGPTETNVCLYYRVTAEDLQRDKPVYIGAPLPGQTALVLDDQGLPVSAPGAIGELVIEGSCVTPGYRNRVDPANADNHLQGRHATGDLVGYENGYLYYHGRKDRMLKINGYRVELGEIEAALSTMPGIREIAVVAEITEQAQNLIAYFSAVDPASAPSVLAIKQHCQTRLPRYMIPKLVRRLDELPKSRNGKIDYLALKALAFKPNVTPQTHTDPVA
ncbi:Non-ribosomal peptide synthetase modules and related protein [Hahella chejuensis KCTC 2396]|uniref:Non-ribosomal peptide synthetase modules and related protein n=1 Tax=Hahella chejuensis (strain KCTC 2396) TaxID=349521 RepID=Q2S9J2_HAHCH|nr:amino acid adenylation domain-containing protein [Hahella chejuensis]ABB69081.1 putative L-prolyl-AMP ligase [Hahella chejuensis KCTC 2396]ABC32682.1 Non-ribosomal peptide synthetase modules and related protein [Hahella chejuensis KCTC 2396]